MSPQRDRERATGAANDPGGPAFRGAGEPPSAAAGSAAVELELRADVRPSIRAEFAAPPSLVHPEGPDLGPLNSALAQFGAQRIEPSFVPAPIAFAQPGTTSESGLPPDAASDPDLKRFIRVYFESSADTTAIARALAKLPEVERAVPVEDGIPPAGPLSEPLVGTTDDVSVDPATGLEFQWYVFRCRANTAWGQATGRGVVIADIDFGFLTTHQDLTIERRFNAFDGSTNVSQGASIMHGTAVLGLAAAPNNGAGIVGFAFEAARWAIQANTTGTSTIPGDAWARAIEFVRTADSGGRRKVILLEVQTRNFGNYEAVPSVNEAIRRAVRDGIVVCVPAGNGDKSADVDDLGNPIPETGSILIGATAFSNGTNSRAAFSNFGTRVAVSAPGDMAHDVTCDSKADNGYRNMFGGTSGAAPKVAGTVALMLQANPRLTPADVKAILSAGTSVLTDASKPVGVFLDTAAAVAEAVNRLT